MSNVLNVVTGNYPDALVREVIQILKPGHQYVQRLQMGKVTRPAIVLDFQEGSRAEGEVNGTSLQAVLACLIDRLQFLQASPETRSREYAMALIKLEEALGWLWLHMEPVKKEEPAPVSEKTDAAKEPKKEEPQKE